jgi:DNA-binding transcriptional ArsR family regulator
MEAVLKAIAEPRRRRILEIIGDGEVTAGAIAAHFDVTRSAVSQHLGILKDAGLLAERREGTRRLYRARPEGFADVRDFLDQFWSEGLVRLKHAAEREERTRDRAASRN